MTDSCPSCCARGIPPRASRTGRTATVHGYRCPCGHVWTTSRLHAAYGTTPTGRRLTTSHPSRTTATATAREGTP